MGGDTGPEVLESRYLLTNLLIPLRLYGVLGRATDRRWAVGLSERVQRDVGRVSCPTPARTPFVSSSPDPSLGPTLRAGS